MIKENNVQAASLENLGGAGQNLKSVATVLEQALKTSHSYEDIYKLH